MFFPGDKLAKGHYTIVEELGQGGMGVVYHCYDELLHRDMVVKMLLPELMDELSVTNGFYREAQLAAQLHHPNIVTIYDLGKEEQKGKIFHFIAMEYLPGGSLSRQIKHKTLSMENTLCWMNQLASGLLFAHQKKIVHQDIKSDNVFITNEGDLKIGDFGLAKLVAGLMKSRTMNGMGTPAYMSPELCQGLSQDYRSDIYSLGVLFFEIVTKQLPYQAKGLIEMAMKHMNAPIPSARNINPDVPEILDALIQRMMSKLPQERFQSLEEVVPILERLIVEIRVTRLGLMGQKDIGKQPAIKDTVKEATAKPKVKKKPELLWSFHTNGPIGWLSQPVMNRDGKILYIGSSDGCLYTLYASSGKLMWKFQSGGPVLAAPLILADKVVLPSADGVMYALSNNEGELVWKFDAGAALLSTPVGRGGRLYVTSSDGMLSAIDSQNGSLQWQYKTGKAIVSSPQSLGDLLFITSKDHKLYALSVLNGKLCWTFDAKGPLVSTPAVSVDAVYAGSLNGSFYALEASTGNLMWEYETAAPITSRGVIVYTSIVFSSWDQRLYGCDKYDGHIVWKKPLKKPMLANLVSANGMVYVVTGSDLWCFHAQSGELEWQLPLNKQVESPVLVAADWLFTGSVEGDLLAYSLV